MDAYAEDVMDLPLNDPKRMSTLDTGVLFLRLKRNTTGRNSMYETYDCGPKRCTLTIRIPWCVGLLIAPVEAFVRRRLDWRKH